MRSIGHAARWALSGLVASALAGCGGSGDPAVASEGQAVQVSAEVAKDLAQLRRLVAPFHDLEKAKAAGWTVEVTPCLENPPEGAMGYHYGNPTFINRVEAAVLEPELLLYEPQADGSFRFVGVEYIVPFALLPETASPPVLLGQEFHQNLGAGLWALHVWVGRHNPSGLFADWNPKVSCEFAVTP